MNARRRIGGHFGSALQAATKKQKIGWRDEIDAEAPNPAPERDSESEDVIDPGTPLPSDDEVEQQATKEVVAEVSAADGEKQAQETPAPAAVPEAESAQPTQVDAPSATIALELAVGDQVLSVFTVALVGRVDEPLQKRLAGCLPPGGDVVELFGGKACTFAGHATIPPAFWHKGQAALQPAPEVTISGKDGAERIAGLPAKQEPPQPEPAAIEQSVEHAMPTTKGWLMAPSGPETPGLILSLSEEELPALKASHRPVGVVVAGQGCFRRLAVLAPRTGDKKPRVPLTVRVHLDNNPSNNALLPLKPSQADLKGKLLELEEPAMETVAEQLDLAELEINGRDVEVSELKQMQFSRERAEGVAALELSLEGIVSKLQKLDGLDEPQAMQRSWQQERANHLLRILGKLR